MATNTQVIENFIKQTGKATHNGSGWDITLHYNGNFLYSYNTVIAKLDTTTNTILLSDTTMTPTTAKHRSTLINEAIKNNIKVLPIPLTMHKAQFPTNEEVLNRFETRMDYLSRGTDLALADKRKSFLTTFADYTEFSKYANITSENADKYTNISNSINDTNYLKTLMEKRRQFQAELRKNKAQLFMELDMSNG